MRQVVIATPTLPAASAAPSPGKVPPAPRRDCERGRPIPHHPPTASAPRSLQSVPAIHSSQRRRDFQSRLFAARTSAAVILPANLCACLGAHIAPARLQISPTLQRHRARHSIPASSVSHWQPNARRRRMSTASDAPNCAASMNCRLHGEMSAFLRKLLLRQPRLLA